MPTSYMDTSDAPSPSRYEISENPEGGIKLNIHGNMGVGNAGQMIDELTDLLSDYSLYSLTVASDKVDYLDDFGT
mgnify:CR=1 FL=1